MKFLDLSIIVSIVAGRHFRCPEERQEHSCKSSFIPSGLSSLEPALYCAGELVGLEKPDSFSWVYDLASNLSALEDQSK
jgi:hypothetical protein